MKVKPSFGVLDTNLPAYGRHIFICTHGNCDPQSQTVELLKRLHELNEQYDRARFSNGERLVITQSGCLGVCMGGPVLVVYPDGVWYAAVDETKLERIYREHLLGGTPVTELILHRHYLAGHEAPYAPDLRQDQTVDPMLALAEQAAAEESHQCGNPGSKVISERVAAARARRQARTERTNAG